MGAEIDRLAVHSGQLRRSRLKLRQRHGGPIARARRAALHGDKDHRLLTVGSDWLLWTGPLFECALQGWTTIYRAARLGDQGAAPDPVIVEEHSEQDRPQEERARNRDTEARAELAGDCDQRDNQAEPEEHDRRAAEPDAYSSGPKGRDNHRAKRHGEAGHDPRALNPCRRARIAHEALRYPLSEDDQQEEDRADHQQEQGDGRVPPETHLERDRRCGKGQEGEEPRPPFEEPAGRQSLRLVP